jgi:exodeoxyribonuclease V alpha subunit
VRAPHKTTEYPEIDYLIREWGLPLDRHPLVRALMHGPLGEEDDSMVDPEDPGSTALRIPDGLEQPDSWGGAAVLWTDTEAITPLVLSRSAGSLHLQTRRFFEAERTIARELLERLGRPASPLSISVEQFLDCPLLTDLKVKQREVVRTALTSCVSLITGGPGTGKTHTMARLLARWVQISLPNPPVVLLAAPTGKAALRMREAVEAATSKLEESDPVGRELRRITAGACTLHQLLGFNPATGRCRFRAENQLRADVVIVDECSMMDTLLWRALLIALPSTAQLVLLGDPNQLESVAAGDVLGSLVQRVFDDGSPSPLTRVAVHLTESVRYEDRPDIGKIAEAVVGRDSLKAKDTLRKATGGDGTPERGLQWIGDHGNRFDWNSLPVKVRALLLEVATADTPAAGLAALDRIRLLTAHRNAGLGAIGLSARVHEAIRSELKESAPGRTANEPVIINRNDRETGLRNGSVGLIMAEGDGRVAYFPGAGGGPPLRLEMGQLPEHRHAPAWAMTIHRSQGSEFEHVVVVLPRPESRLATRELVYTGITRARKYLHVWGPLETIDRAAEDRGRRNTLLLERLRELVHARSTTPAQNP